MSGSRLRQQLMGEAAGACSDKYHAPMTTARANCHPFRAYNLSDYARRLDSLFNGRRLKGLVNDGYAPADLAGQSAESLTEIQGTEQGMKPLHPNPISRPHIAATDTASLYENETTPPAAQAQASRSQAPACAGTSRQDQDAAEKGSVSDQTAGGSL